MALGEATVDQHISHWTERLGAGMRPYRKHWPARLFHHAPLENALAIAREGCLRARNDPERAQILDVAAGGVIDNRQEAHGRVRLYFRPRTPTQFHIEGIRKPADCQYGPGAHAPILVMYVLDAKKLLLKPNTIFSDQNMQNHAARTGDDEAFFGAIPFENVYHEGGINGDYSIIAHRCAEVLPESPLLLSDVLSGIWFRSEPERDTFLHMLGDVASQWHDFCSVSEELKVFDKRFAFLSDISLSTEGISFRINHRHDLQTVSLAIQAYNAAGDLCINFKNDNFTTYNKSSGRWIYRTTLNPSNYLVKVQIENNLAYEGVIRLDDSLF